MAISHVFLLFIKLILLIFQAAWSKAEGDWQAKAIQVNSGLMETNN